MKKIRYLAAGICITGSIGILLFTGCKSQTPESENQAFQKFTNQVFCEEISSNTISIHYTLKNPENYGIENRKITFGSFETDANNLHASVENLKRVMKTFDYNKLSVKNSLTYDIMQYYLAEADEDAEYLLYEEPLGLINGVQTQLPVILSEYPFDKRADVDIYLELMEITPDYFDSLIAFEEKKASKGIFMSDEAIGQVLEQCQAFLDMKENNYLFSTFVDRINTLGELSEKEKSDYIQKNAKMVEDYILPSYRRLMSELQKKVGTGKNEKGLCYYPKGKEYYEHLVEKSTGSDRSVEEIRAMTKTQMLQDLEAMENVLGISNGAQNQEGEKRQEIEETEESAAIQVDAAIPQNPVSILEDLKSKITISFPDLPEITYSVKYVPDALEEHLSPAFYMIPAIDSFHENVIYVNQSQMGNSMMLFTTLAHEGYPGHLYQTVYFANTKPDPIRTIFSFGGYVEGWATYAEMCSYYLAPITKDQATLLQKNGSIILGMYTLADIGIHYDGWSRSDTLAFYSNYGIKDEETVNHIYDLIIGCPGNYLKYYIGYLEFLELKKTWIEEHGTNATQKEFHKAVLDVGPAPFEIVEKYMGQVEE